MRAAEFRSDHPPIPSPPGGDAPAGPSDLVDVKLLRDLALFVLRAPARHKILAATCFLAVVGAAVTALKVLPKTYQVQATLLAQANPLSLEYNQHDMPTRAAREIVLRRDNVVALLKQTDFVARHQQARAPAAKLKQWVFDAVRGPPKPDELLDGAADSVEERFSVNVPGDGTVDFGFEWSSRDLTFDLVEAAIQSFLEARFAADVSSIGETIAILSEHAKRLNDEVATQTKNVDALEREFRSRGRLRTAARPVARTITRDEAGAETEALLVAKRRSLAEVEEYRQRRTSELQSQLMQQSTIYAERHPVLEATRRNLEAMSAASPQMDALRNEVAQLERSIKRRGGSPTDVIREQPFTGSVPSLSTDSLDDPRLEYERYKLRLVVRQQAALLERIDTARFAMDTARAGFKYRYSVVKPPQMPKAPVKPKPAKVIAGGLVGGVFFAVFVCVAFDLWGGLLVERSQVERQLRLRLLGASSGR